MKRARVFSWGLLALWPALLAADNPAPPPSAAAIQAWVFDGGYDASKLVGLSLTHHGVFGYAAFTGDYRCADGSDAGPGGFLQLSPSQVGAFLAPPALPVGGLPAVPVALAPSLDPAMASPATPPSPDPILTATDCAALQNEAAVNGHVSGLLGQGNALVVQVAACLQAVKALVCGVNHAFAQLGAFCQANPEGCTGPPGGWLCPLGNMEGAGDLGDWFIEPCAECAQSLAEMGARVAEAGYELNRCNAVRSDLEAIRDAALAAATPSGGNSMGRTYMLTCVPPMIPELVGKADSAWLTVNSIVSGMPAISAACSHDSLVANCELCGSEPRERVPILPSGLVSLRRSGRALGRLKGALQSAASTTSDPALAAKYAGLAGRMGSIADHRVLEVSAPASAPFSQEFVALRPAGAADDGQEPLAVVLSLVRPRGRGAVLNRADRELLRAATEAFKTALVPGRPCPTCPTLP